ncbi:hypothetical protein ACTU3I_10755 [Microbacterium sp. RD1]|uniref:hypothetical protein n=1 Tax=Microbacterium sp. RD1 TaxID=3457313 RepID=UPI003FA6061C
MTRSVLTAAAALGALVLSIALAGCVPEPQISDSPAPSASGSSSPSAAGSSTPTPSASAAALPTDCGAVYSAGMRATLESQVPPLNDPGLTMYSTQNAALLELLDSVPSLRCTWGAAGEVGMATTLAAVNAEQSATISDALAASGFGCATDSGAMICEIEQRGVSLEDEPFTRGETHALRDGLWVATSWLNVDPEGYTTDILATVGG